MAALRQFLKLPVRNPSTLKTTFTNVRNLSVNTTCKSAYDSDGKTVVSVMNNEEDAPLMINSYSILGFRLNNGCFVIGPVAIFPHSVLSWDIKDDRDINEKSLSLFLRLFPKLDVLLIGISDARDAKLLLETRNNVRNILGNLKKGDKMNIEVLPTEKAVTTFNFLNAEKRFVAAALVPPTTYSPTLDDEFRVDYLNKKAEEEYLLPTI
ncbi:NADH dehydrogenase [ubiquinone] 1 alpha subcomplex assembly factor 3-like [Macrosteles quadrilineatus]|uniref:NADH dehydrogenase [ubiquinone] 1 alpha subcomplex assembly factor 3-like n=1 Tax=Macrosteles quadrilineatus TaxID=74068 RepID=UPI0023E289B8|nr:NADH dehydrogenase [ubiquinone] 1 alpha subcomplex assembly factor 3-like [Macrosteles quadrilineatus]XP_054284933.1 NADH dehydrogenase [ubiquinone] 1 alpha subcomplex assembly factor 3-like [Macrosteles quadrilineatus]XP_054284934.1 NADH dehydrogenase [ubiquinone] 1 alpha subcomplex assembly factor 3-like [Macrosteles quadrilineatus]